MAETEELDPDFVEMRDAFLAKIKADERLEKSMPFNKAAEKLLKELKKEGIDADISTGSAHSTGVTWRGVGIGAGMLPLKALAAKMTPEERLKRADYLSSATPVSSSELVRESPRKGPGVAKIKMRGESDVKEEKRRAGNIIVDVFNEAAEIIAKGEPLTKEEEKELKRIEETVEKATRKIAKERGLHFLVTYVEKFEHPYASLNMGHSTLNEFKKGKIPTRVWFHDETEAGIRKRGKAKVKELARKLPI